MKYTQRNRSKFHPNQKQCSCVHNPRFGIVRKRCVTKQKKDCEHSQPHSHFQLQMKQKPSFQREISEISTSDSYQIERNMITVTATDQNQFHQKEHSHYDHTILNLTIFQRENMNCLFSQFIIHIPTGAILHCSTHCTQKWTSFWNVCKKESFFLSNKCFI